MTNEQFISLLSIIGKLVEESTLALDEQQYSKVETNLTKIAAILDMYADIYRTAPTKPADLD